MTLELRHRDDQIIDPVAVATTIEVDGADAALAEQEIALVQVAMDQSDGIRLPS
jgi:hypothetical protein